MGHQLSPFYCMSCTWRSSVDVCDVIAYGTDIGACVQVVVYIPCPMCHRITINTTMKVGTTRTDVALTSMLDIATFTDLATMVRDTNADWERTYMDDYDDEELYYALTTTPTQDEE